MEGTLSLIRNAQQETDLPKRVHKLSEVLNVCEDELHRQTEYASVRLEFVTYLCEDLLQSLDPEQLSNINTSINLPSHSATPCTSQQQQNIPPMQDLQLSDSKDNDADTDALQQPGHCAEQLTGGNPPTTQSTVLTPATGVPPLAKAWLAAAVALQTVYTWEDEAVVTSVIAFWSDVSNLLHGDWLQEEALQVTNSSNGCHQQQEQLQDQLLYMQWLRRLGPPILSAVVQLLHEFYTLTSISHLQHKNHTQMDRLLLLYLQLQPGNDSRGHAATAAEQLLQLKHWPQQGSSQVASNIAEALSAGEAFRAVCQLLQTSPAATLPTQQHSGDNTHSNSNTSCELSADTAAAFLQGSYGWVCLGMPSTGSINSSSRRPEDTAYDCCMLELLHAMYNGPQAISEVLQHHQQQQSSQRGSKEAEQRRRQHQQWEDWCSTDSFQALAQLVIAYDKPHLLTRGLVALVLQQQQQQGAGDEQGMGQQQQRFPITTAAAMAGPALQKVQMEKAAISKVMQFLDFIYLQPCWSDSNKPAAARAVSKLLQGCVELLRPAANCTMEWRCGALSLMATAVEEFAGLHEDGGGGLHSQPPTVWGDDALGGLLYCLNHDASIKVRRMAMKLLQLVVLPSDSTAAGHLVRTLAAKVCDRDSTVGQAALELLVQLDAGMLCSILTASQWSAVVQAGLQLCSSLDDEPAVGRMGKQAGKQCSTGSQMMCAAGQKEFLALLKSVLMHDAGDVDVTANAFAPSAHQQQLKQLHGMQGHQIRQWLTGSANRVVGLGGCRVVLLLLMKNPELEVLCRAVAHACTEK